MKQIKLLIRLFVLPCLFMSIVPSVSAEDDLLARYDFSTKSKVPVAQHDDVVFGSEFGVFNSSVFPMDPIEIDDDGYLVVRSYGQGVATNRYGYLSITPAPGKIIRITKVIITHFKEPDSNTGNTRCYLYDMGGTTPIATPPIKANLIYKGNGGSVIPETLKEESFIPSQIVEFNTTHFMSLSAMQKSNDESNLSYWKIKSLEFYGEVISPGDISVNKTVDFGYVQLGDEMDGSVNLKVIGGTSETVNIELIDPTSSFFCMQTEVEALDATAGTSIRVTYSPQSPGTHEAQLKFSYADKEAYTLLTGISPILNESFTYYVSDRDIWEEMDSTQVNQYVQEEYLTVPGWIFTDSIYWHLSGSWGLGLELRGSDSEVAKVSTPELDLSMPFGLSFRSKKMSNRATIEGQMYVLVDNDTIWSFENPNNTLNVRTIDGFIANSNSRLSIIGIANDSSLIAVDEISVFPTTTPTLNLPAYASKSFDGSQDELIINIPVTAYQLESDLEIVFNGPSIGFEILTPSIAKATAEAGTNIQIKYTLPTEGEVVQPTVEVKGGGLTDYRYITLVNSEASGVVSPALNAWIVGKQQAVSVRVDTPADIEIYAFDGKIVYSGKVSGTTDIRVNSGFYLVRLINNKGSKIEKIIVR